MANTNAPFGFRLVKDRTNGGTVEYDLVSTYATKLGRGDPVSLNGTGRNVARSATNVVTQIGVVAGIQYVDTQGQTVWANYWPGNVGYTNVKVLVDPIESGQQWMVQTDSMSAEDIGALANFTVADASATLQRSQTVLAVSSPDTTGMTFLIEGLADIPNNAYGAYAVAVGRFVEGANLSALGGV
jgi:hypothetical protein